MNFLTKAMFYFYQIIVGIPFLTLSSQSSVNGRPCVTDVSRNGRSNNVLKPMKSNSLFIFKLKNLTSNI